MESNDVTFNPNNLVSSELAGLKKTDRLISDYSTREDESYYRTVEYEVVVESDRGECAAAGGVV